ncbi:MAG: hypothetical protein K0S55_1976 [Clostridia bacterium]|nr:hypothetical protein [Clostridia bacterium]
MLLNGVGTNGFLEKDDCAKKYEYLLNKAQNGDNLSFEKLMNCYMKIIYNYIILHVSNSEDAKDILQDTMLGVWQGLKSFNRQSVFKTWILGITRRKIADYYRKIYKTKEHEFADIDDYDEYEYLSDDNSGNDIISKIDVNKAVDTLSMQEKELVYLIFNAQLSYSEVEAITKIPLGTVKSKMFSIKSKLKEQLKEGFK